MGFEKYKKFSIIAFEDVNIKNSDCEGNMAVGNNVTLKNFSLAVGVSPRINKEVGNSLIVGGKIDIYNSVNYNGDTISQKIKHPKKYRMINVNGDFKCKKALDFMEVNKDFYKISRFIKNKKPNTLTLISKDRVEFESIFKDEVQFFDIDFDSIKHSLKIFDFKVDNKSPLFINVRGKDIVFDDIEIKINGRNLDLELGNRIVWNIIEADNVTIVNTNFYGIVVAIDSDVKISNATIYGNMFVKNLLGDGEIVFYDIDRYLMKYISDIDIYTLQDINSEKDYKIDNQVKEAIKVEGTHNLKKENIENETMKVVERKFDNIKIFEEQPSLESGLIEILESIAYEENGIASILNAEAEKIKKIVETSGSIDEIICLDKSLNNTLRSLSIIQSLLIYKLDEVEKIMCHSDRLDL